MNLLQKIVSRITGPSAEAATRREPVIAELPNEQATDVAPTSEKGRRAIPENQVKYAYRLMYVDPDLTRAIIDIREMAKLDGRVKRIHSKVARDVIQGGLILTQTVENKTITREWESFKRRLQLGNVQKLKSDAIGLVSEGNLPMQWVLDKAFNVVSCVRMPSETILPNVGEGGRFNDVTKAYIQVDVMTGTELAIFPLWQLTHARYDPENFDDLGSMGRPFLDASRSCWRKLKMTEEDLVIRRRTRAPQKLAHVLKGATKPELDDYRAQVENDQNDITTDFYLNKEGSVSAVQGDANLDQINDIVHLLDTFFAGTPLPKGMMGYTDGLARDILEDLKRDYYDEVDVLQDTLSYVYDQGFRLHLMLKKINPDAENYTVTFKQRRTETPSQTADRALKMQALGFPRGMVFEEMGYDPVAVHDRKEAEAKLYDPYPEDGSAETDPKVSITPGNEPKGGSATSITNQ